MPRLFSLTHGALPYWRRALSHLGSGNRSGDAPFTSPNIQKKYYPNNKMRPSTLFFLCRGEPNCTLMRDYRTEQSPPYLRTLVRTAPMLATLSAYPRVYGTRTLLPYLRTLAHTAPILATLSAYPRAYGSDAPPPCSVPLYWFLRILLPLPTYVLDHLSIPTL